MGYQDNYANNVANIYQNLGNAQAQARLQQGAGWANAFGQIGQLASQIPGQMAQQKKDAQQQELMGINLEVARKNLSDINNRGANATIVSDALKTSMVNGQFDEGVFRAYFTSAGRPELAAPALQEFYDLETSRLANQSANFKSQADKDAADAKVFKGIATKIYDSNFSPVELNGYLAYIAKTRPEYGAEVARLLIQATKDPDGFIQTVVTMAKNPAPELKPLTQPPGSQTLMPKYDPLNRPTGQYGEPMQGPAKPVSAKPEIFVVNGKRQTLLITDDGELLDPVTRKPIELAPGSTVEKYLEPKEPRALDYEWVRRPDGSIGYLTPDEIRNTGATKIDTPRPNTEDEKKTIGFVRQVTQAIDIMDSIEDELTEPELYQIQSLPQEDLAGWANRSNTSENAKRYLRALEQFTEAALRPVSGAAIQPSEYAQYRRTYAKQFGETPQLADDRRKARGTIKSSLESRAGSLFTAGGGDTTQKPTLSADGLTVMTAAGPMTFLTKEDAMGYYKAIGGGQ